MKTHDDAPWYIRGRTSRRIWANAYNDADRIFNPPNGMGGHGGPRYRPGPIAETVVNGLVRKGRRVDFGRARSMPYPGGLVYLGGPLLCIYVADSQGHIHIGKQWSVSTGPMAMWSMSIYPRSFPSGGSVVAFHGKRIPRPTMSAETIPELLSTYREWHAGKAPRGLSKILISKPPRLGPKMVCVATKYQSDKFSKSGMPTQYIHVHESDGVTAEIGSGVLISGGKLRLTAGGLVG